MSKLSKYIGSQFGNPTGIIGKCCCVIMNIINNAMYRKVVNLLNAKENDKILDIGYGNGYLVQQMYKKYRSNMYGIDISEDMKSCANNRNRKGVSEDKIHLEVGDCCELRYENDFFHNSLLTKSAIIENFTCNRNFYVIKCPQIFSAS